MEKLNSLRVSIRGSKTYLILFSAAVCVLVEVGLGVDVPGFDAGPDWAAYLFGIAAGATVRSGIKRDVRGY